MPTTSAPSHFGLHVAGRDRTDDLGRALSEAADRRASGYLESLLTGESDILGLAQATDTSDYLTKHIERMRFRTSVDVSALRVVRKPGVLGAISAFLRTVFWRALRYPHNWVSYQQNAINVQLAYELDFEHEERKRQVAALEERLRKVEAAQGGDAPREGPA